MSRREDIENSIWSDPDFSSLSPDAKLVYLWSFTNPRCGMAGIYKLALAPVAPELGMSLTRLESALGHLARDGVEGAGMAFYERGVLWVRSRVKHLRSKSPQMAKSVASDLRKLPPVHPLVVRFMAMYRSDSWLREDLGIAYAEGIGNLSKNPIDIGDSDNLSGGSPEPPGEGQGEGQGTLIGVGGSGGKEKSDLPADFPADLRPHLTAAYRVLRDLAERHGAKKIEPLSLASVVMARRHKPLVRAAHDFAGWADGKAQRRKDVVAGYRNWLDNTDDLAGIEHLDGAGTPAAVISIVPRNRKSTPSDMWRAINGESA